MRLATVILLVLTTTWNVRAADPSRQRQEALLEPGLREPVCRLLSRNDAHLPAFCVRFTDNGDGTITDRETGLTWLRNASCTEIPRTDSGGKASFADAKAGVAQLRDGLCGLDDGSGPGDWRLPTEEEWQHLIDQAASNGCLSPGPFIPDTTGLGCWSEGDPFHGVLEAVYWSSTNTGGVPPRVMVAILFYGNLFGGSPFFKVQVWPVR